MSPLWAAGSGASEWSEGRGGARRLPVIRSSGGGTVLRSSLQIRCEQEHIREVAIAPGDAAGPRCSGDGGEVGAVAGRGVVGREGLGGRRGAWRGWCWWQLETLESAPAPLGAAAAAK